MTHLPQHPDCGESTDRGFSYACGKGDVGTVIACGLFFCSEHCPHLIEDEAGWGSTPDEGVIPRDTLFAATLLGATVEALREEPRMPSTDEQSNGGAREEVADTEEWQREDVIVAMPHPERPILMRRDGGSEARAA